MDREPSESRHDNVIFVVHGRNEDARVAMFEFLRSLGLCPLEWEDVVRLTGEPSPYIGKILEVGFRYARAVVVLVTGDDFAMLRPAYQEIAKRTETRLRPQPRLNSVFEAGMAFGKQPEHTILVTLGETELFSDIAGRYGVAMDNTVGAREVLRGRLITAGCSIQDETDEWKRAGNFEGATFSDSSYTREILSPIKQSSGDAPEPQKVIGNAEHTVLLLGTSHLRVVSGERQGYLQWLNKHPTREIGVLFLNPYSPHAFSRRLEQKRSNSSDIAEAIRYAVRFSNEHGQFRFQIYDGPYRYSANARDLGIAGLAGSNIVMMFSSHSEGIAEGFRTKLTREFDPGVFEFYEDELLTLWRRSMANPPGHGVSVVARWKDAPPKSELSREVEKLLGEVKPEKGTFVPSLFYRQQLHVTITSLCRTQQLGDRYAPSLRVGSGDSATFLPSHFPHFVSEAVDIIVGKKLQELSFSFTIAKLSPNGHIMLECEAENVALTALWDDLRQLAHKFANTYPHERDSWESLRHLPKFDRFRAHVTVGMAIINCPPALPRYYVGNGGFIRLSHPVSLRTDKLSIVHYAYRSLLRCVGEIDLSLRGNPKITPTDVERELGIKTALAQRAATVFRSIEGNEY